MKDYELYLADCISTMQKLERNSVDMCVTDPPYNLDFMSKKWDDVGGPLEFQQWCEEWGKELLKVLKPGAFALVFGGTRTHHRLTAGLEDAGFEIRDEILWMYLSGFPKGKDIANSLDSYLGYERVYGKERQYPDGGKASARKSLGKKLTNHVYGTQIAKKSTLYESIPQSEEAKLWWDYKTCLKPFWEPIILCRKPKEGTYVENILKWGVGALNIRDSRIPIQLENEDDPRAHNQEKNYKYTSEGDASPVTFLQSDGKRKEHIQQLYTMRGRYPGNVIIDEMIAELFNMIKSYDNKEKFKLNNDVDRNLPNATWNTENCGYSEKAQKKGVCTYGDSGGMSKMFKNVENWVSPTKTVFGDSFKRSFEHFNLKDGGGMGKFFYCPKAHKSEREVGLDDIKERKRDTSRNLPADSAHNRNHPVKNFHPTVKPIKLLTYLVRLIRPPTAKPVMIDPFAGSGSHGIAARIENCYPILIEANKKYGELIKGRMEVPLHKYRKWTDSVVNIELKNNLEITDF